MRQTSIGIQADRQIDRYKSSKAQSKTNGHAPAPQPAFLLQCYSLSKALSKTNGHGREAERLQPPPRGCNLLRWQKLLGTERTPSSSWMYVTVPGH
jgi:hypothetical protein